MPIDIVCPGCKPQLEAPAGSSGKQFRCPICNTVVTVPGLAGTTGSVMNAGSNRPANTEPLNPYQSPEESDQPPESAGFAAENWQLTQVSPWTIFSRAYLVFRARYKYIVFAQFVGMMGIYAFGFLIGAPVAFLLRNNQMPPVLPLILIPGGLLFVVFILWISVGQAIYLLKVSQGPAATHP